MLCGNRLTSVASSWFLGICPFGEGYSHTTALHNRLAQVELWPAIGWLLGLFVCLPAVTRNFQRFAVERTS